MLRLSIVDIISIRRNDRLPQWPQYTCDRDFYDSQRFLLRSNYATAIGHFVWIYFRVHKSRNWMRVRQTQSEHIVVQSFLHCVKFCFLLRDIFAMLLIHSQEKRICKFLRTLQTFPTRLWHVLRHPLLRQPRADQSPVSMHIKIQNICLVISWWQNVYKYISAIYLLTLSIKAHFKMMI